MEFNHKSVLLNESIEGLNIRPEGIYVDGTTGGGGHSKEIASKLDAVGKLICIDRDTEALSHAMGVLDPFDKYITYVHNDYKRLPHILESEGVEGVDGILLDLGVSSYQLDEPSRGFSYMAEDAPLDMRMDKDADLTAADVCNTYEEEDLADIFKAYGEERFAKKIAGRIVVEREKNPLKTTGDLNRIIASCLPKITPGGHPSKRVFMALRIEVNGELSGLYDFITELPDLINPGGRICIISFHSLEDRIVKQAFKALADPCICPKDFPVCTCKRKPKGVIVTKKPILPSEEEIKENKRAKSAKLRIFEVRKQEL